MDSHLAFYTVGLFFFPNAEHDSHFSIFPSLRFWMERVAWAVLYRICWFTGWVLSILSPLAFFLRPSSCSVLLPSRTRQVQWFLLFCMDFFLDLVSESPTPSSMVMILMVLDASVIPAVVGSTADTDSEIGARLGVCFTFTGQANSSNLATRADKLIICYPIRLRGTYRYVPLNWKNKRLRDLSPWQELLLLALFFPTHLCGGNLRYFQDWASWAERPVFLGRVTYSLGEKKLNGFKDRPRSKYGITQATLRNS